jgi:anti-sigma factor RsiW
MNCEELARLIPDIVEDQLPDALRAEVEAALPNCPDCQREIELARQVRVVLSTLRETYPQLQVPPGFEGRLLARLQRQQHGFELLDLSSQVFGSWIIEWINLISGLISTLGLQLPEET